MDWEKDEESENQTFRIDYSVRAVRDAANYVPTGRNIIVCLDGTGDMFDDDNSNIVHFVSCLKKSDPSQVTYYQSGIGTYDGGGLSGGFNAAFDGAVGSGLGVHIRDGYKFLMENYKEGDKIALIGFSRGAYTARCLAGFVHKMGILPAHNYSQVDFAYQIYKDDSDVGWEKSKEFKKTFCMNVNIDFIGVFDSVASVGFFPRKLPLSSTPTNTATYFRHAIAVDERRAKFKSCRFKQKISMGKDSWKVAVELTPTQSRVLDSRPETDAKEVFFTGCHADVGGGAVKNDVRSRLANIPLRWMIRQCFECNTGIIFKTRLLAEKGLDVHTLSPVYVEPSTTIKSPPKQVLASYEAGTLPSMVRRSNVLEQSSSREVNGAQTLKLSSNKMNLEHGWLPEQWEDHFDSKAPINDMLKIAKSWWVLEVWPVKVRFLKKDSEEWVKKVRMNLGRPRIIQDQRPLIHWTVHHRLHDESIGYKPKIRSLRNMEWNIVQS